MLSKNNYKERLRQLDEKKERFSIRKLSIGAASVLIGLTLFGVGGISQVHASELNGENASEKVESQSNQNQLKDNKVNTNAQETTMSLS